MKKKEDEITVIIDGNQVDCHEGMTILEAADKAGIKIPTLCHSPDLKPTGVCRVCVVEVEGMTRLVDSCHTPVIDGMVIHTNSDMALSARKVTLNLLMIEHTGECLLDDNTKNCTLR